MGKTNTNIIIRYMYVPTGLAGMAVKTKQNRCRALRLGGREEGGAERASGKKRGVAEEEEGGCEAGCQIVRWQI